MKYEIWNMKHETWNMKHEIWNMKQTKTKNRFSKKIFSIVLFTSKQVQDTKFDYLNEICTLINCLNEKRKKKNIAKFE